MAFEMTKCNVISKMLQDRRFIGWGGIYVKGSVGEAYSRRLISMACPTSQSAMPLRPATSKLGEHETFGHSGLIVAYSGLLVIRAITC